MRKHKTGRLVAHILLAWVVLAAALPWYLGPAAGTPPGGRPETGRAEAAVTAARDAGPSRDEVLLAMAIHGEARGEPFTGQVAVGAVILNRVASEQFPDSIGGVIFQPGAFTAVTDGQIDLPPDAQAFRAARAALSGWDPSDGALYYYNPARSSSPWIWTRPVIKRIGRHVFAA